MVTITFITIFEILQIEYCRNFIIKSQTNVDIVVAVCGLRNLELTVKILASIGLL